MFIKSACLILLTAFTLYALSCTQRSPAAPLPPLVPGFFLLGNSLQLGRRGADFPRGCRKQVGHIPTALNTAFAHGRKLNLACVVQYGDFYSLSLAGRWMTIVCNPQAATGLLRAPTNTVAFR